MPDFRIGVDIGGTFTDIVFLGERRPGADPQGRQHPR